MRQKIYQVDAFADKVFSGNPAAVCPLDEWLSDELLQNIAAENNLAETAYYAQQGDAFHIRWFTPTVEVDLCGHATLAAAHVLFACENYPGNTISFFSPRSGDLSVVRDGNYLTLNFPADVFREVELTPELLAPFNQKPVKAFRGKTDYMLVFEDQDQVELANPDLAKIASLDCRGLIITAPGREVDFVSRFFAPQSGIDEDPVTGSAHTTLTPYWAKVLGKKELTAMQLSARKGLLKCRDAGERVEIGGQAALYMVGEIYI